MAQAAQVPKVHYHCYNCRTLHTQNAHPKDPRPRRVWQGTCPNCNRYSTHHIYEKAPITGNWR